MIRQFASRQFLVFLFTGGTAAAVNFGSRILYNRWTDYRTAIVFAYLTGMLTAFILARLFVFKASTQTMQRSVFFFCLVNLVAVLQTWLISVGLAEYAFPAAGMAWHPLDVAHAIGVMVPVFTSYLGHKRWSFR